MNFQKYFKDKTVLVTGSGRGIGLEITKEYLEHGAKVIAIDFNSHNILPFVENISFFTNEDISSFDTALINSLDVKNLSEEQKYQISLDSRAKKIIEILP